MSNNINNRPKMKNIILLGLSSLLNDVSSEMILPILPMFITSLGGNKVIIGIAGGLRDSIANILMVVSGYWSDRTGKRRIFVFSGYAISSICKLFLAYSTSWFYALIFSGLERTGKGLRSAPRDAIIAESMPHQKGRGFGIHRTFDTTGAIIGTLLSFVLFWFAGLNLKTIIITSAGIALLSLIPLIWVKEKKRKIRKHLLKLTMKQLSPEFKFFTFIATIFSISNISYMFFILKAQSAFTGKLSIGAPILLYLVFNIFYASAAIPLGILTDKIGRMVVILSGYFLFSLISFGFAYIHSSIMFIIFFALYGLVYASINSNQRAIITEISNNEAKATSLGIFHTTIGITSLVGNMIAGFLWEHFSVEVTFFYAGIISSISVLLFLSFYRFFKLK